MTLSKVFLGTDSKVKAVGRVKTSSSPLAQLANVAPVAAVKKAELPFRKLRRFGLFIISLITSLMCELKDVFSVSRCMLSPIIKGILIFKNKTPKKTTVFSILTET